jgi:hypothetical protein
MRNRPVPKKLGVSLLLSIDRADNAVQRACGLASIDQSGAIGTEATFALIAKLQTAVHRIWHAEQLYSAASGRVALPRGIEPRFQP